MKNKVIILMISFTLFMIGSACSPRHAGYVGFNGDDVSYGYRFEAGSVFHDPGKHHYKKHYKDRKKQEKYWKKYKKRQEKEYKKWRKKHKHD